MNRILTADVIITLTLDQASAMLEVCELYQERSGAVGCFLSDTEAGKAVLVFVQQCAKQGVKP